MTKHENGAGNRSARTTGMAHSTAQRLRRFGAGLVVALPVTLAAAGAITVTSSVATAPHAHAWGLSDIAGGVVKGIKKVGKTAKKGAGIAYEFGKGAATTTAKGAFAATSDVVVRPALKGAELTERALGTGDKAKYDIARQGLDEGNATFRNAIDRGVKYAEDKAKQGFGKVAGSGKLTSRNQKNRPGQWGANARTGATKNIRRRTVQGQVVRKGTSALPPARHFFTPAGPGHYPRKSQAARPGDKGHQTQAPKAASTRLPATVRSGAVPWVSTSQGR